MNIEINGEPVARNLDIAATAADRPSNLAFTAPDKEKLYEGMNRATDLVFDDIRPKHGVIAVRFIGGKGAEAVVSAIEVGPGPGGKGATPRGLAQ